MIKGNGNAKPPPDFIEDEQALGNDFGSDSVTGDHCNTMGDC